MYGKSSTTLTIVIALVIVLSAGSVFAAGPFSADLTMKSGGDTLIGTIKVSGDFYRIDVVQKGLPLFIIVDQTVGITRVFDPAAKEYREIGSQDMMSLMNDPFQSAIYAKSIATEKNLGAETVAGMECDKLQYSKDGQDMMIVWQSKDLEFPVKIENLIDKNYWAEMANIKKGEIKKALFETPAEFSLFGEKEASDPNSDLDIVNAAGMGNLAVIKKHLANGIDVNFSSGDGYTPLLMAALYGKIDAVKLLIEAGADVNKVTETGSSALLVAVQYGKMDIIKVLVEAGANVNMIFDNGYTTVLMDAVKYGHKDVVKFLIESGADVKFQNSLGESIMKVANKDDSEMLEILKKAGIE
ncbi:MAG: ankyrin repeat domain-containing protein [Candidatus Zixiibacteriota bacterium]